jgi:hypothetical protein
METSVGLPRTAIALEPAALAYSHSPQSNRGNG